MIKHLAILFTAALATNAIAVSSYGPTRFFDDVDVPSWGAITNLDYDTTTSGTYTNGTYTNYYRLCATNIEGRLPVSSNLAVTFTAHTNLTNAITVSWPLSAGIDDYVIERSYDAGATWTNWTTVGPTETNWTDYGTNTYTGTNSFTNTYTTLLTAADIDLSTAGSVKVPDPDGNADRAARLQDVNNAVTNWWLLPPSSLIQIATNNYSPGDVLKTSDGTNWYWAEDNFEANTDDQTATEVTSTGTYANVQAWLNVLAELAFEDWPASDGAEYVAKDGAWFEHTDDTGTDDQTLSWDGTNVSIEDGNSVDISDVDTDTTYSAGTNLDLNGTVFSLDAAAQASDDLADSAWQNPDSATNWTWTSDGSEITLTGYSGPNAVVIPEMLDGLPVTTLSNELFESSSSTSVSGGKNITTIADMGLGDGVFEGSDLTNIALPSLTDLGDNAFFGCSGLTSVNFPALENMGSDAFAFCSNLTNAVLLAVTNFDYEAFLNCSSLVSVYFSGDAPTIGTDIYSGATSVTNYVTNPTATGWGDTLDGQPVVRMTVHADDFEGGSAGETNAITASGLVDISDSLANAGSALQPADTNGVVLAESATAGDIMVYTGSAWATGRVEVAAGSGGITIGVATNNGTVTWTVNDDDAGGGGGGGASPQRIQWVADAEDVHILVQDAATGFREETLDNGTYQAVGLGYYSVSNVVQQDTIQINVPMPGTWTSWTNIAVPYFADATNLLYTGNVYGVQFDASWLQTNITSSLYSFSGYPDAADTPEAITIGAGDLSSTNYHAFLINIQADTVSSNALWWQGAWYEQ